MECPECKGIGTINLPYISEVVDCIIECPSCEGEGKLLGGELYPNRCPACGHPIRQGQKWCGFHREAENFIP